jgi:hypothetical protein
MATGEHAISYHENPKPHALNYRCKIMYSMQMDVYSVLRKYREMANCCGLWKINVLLTHMENTAATHGSSSVLAGSWIW